MVEKSVFELFKKTCEENRDKIAYRYKKDEEWKPVTWGETQETCKIISKSLIALGVKKNDKVAILSQTRLEWIQLDFAIVSIGAVVVGIYATSLAKDCAYIINHSDAVMIIVENQEQLEKIVTVRGDLPKLKHIVIIDGDSQNIEGVISWQEFVAMGANISDDEFQAWASGIQNDDLATLVYTSGTTGVPKGAMLTHGNLLFSSWAIRQSILIEPHFESILFLPLAHVFAKMIVYAGMRTAQPISIAESIEKAADNIREVRPHFFASVPRLYEKAYAKITDNALSAGGIKSKIFNWGVKIGYEVSKLQQQKKPVTGLLSFKHKIANKLVFSKVQAALGGNLVYAISGAAPLNKSIAEFLHACGILVLEGIGMTENTSFTNINRYDHYKFGSVGPTGPEIEQKVTEEGEVLYRGKNVMLGYYKDPEATQEAIDEDGWLYTGDLGKIDEDGFFFVTGRKKDLIITSGGKNIGPERIEKIMQTSRYLNQVVIYGDQKKYLTAVVTLVEEQVREWAEEQGIKFDSWEELCKHPQVIDLIDCEVEEKNRSLSSFESLKKVLITPHEFSIDSGELTATLKTKRKVIINRFKEQLDALYED